jgi:hypothetical protein
LLTGDAVWVELWTSWASMLRVYAAAHGLTSEHHAVVEVGAEEIVLRVDTRWVRFTRDRRSGSDGVTAPFELGVDGRVQIGNKTEEMDMAAEEVAREMLAGG